MNNLNITGIYTYFYRDIDCILLMKSGKGKSIKKRIESHMTSCAGLTLGPYWQTSRYSLHDSETKIKELLGKRYEKIRDETFIIHDSIEEATQYLIENFDDKALFGSKGKRNNVNYNVTTLFGVEDIREHRPPSYFHPSKRAAPTTEVGPDEDWRKTWTCISRSGKLLDEPVKAYHDQQTWNAIRGERRYQKYLRGELKEKESPLQQFMTA